MKVWDMGTSVEGREGGDGERESRMTLHLILLDQ